MGGVPSKDRLRCDSSDAYGAALQHVFDTDRASGGGVLKNHALTVHYASCLEQTLKLPRVALEGATQIKQTLTSTTHVNKSRDVLEVEIFHGCIGCTQV